MTVEIQERPLPHWQLSSLYSGFDGQDYQEAKAALQRELEALENLAREHGLGKRDDLNVDDATVVLFEELLTRFNRFLGDLSSLRAFIYGFVSTDAFNNQAQAELSELKPVFSRVDVFSKRLTAWLGSLKLGKLLEHSEVARAHAYPLERVAVEAEHLMSDAEEELVSLAEQTGSSAWSKLHGDLSSRGTIRMVFPGREEREYTVTDLKNLQAEADPELRKAAFEAELELLTRHAVSYAAAMNSIKGYVNMVGARRGWESPLEETLFESRISRRSLEAMQEACKESFPVFRSYLKAKAKFLGKEKLAWYDLQAPVTLGEPKRYSWEEAQATVVKNFRLYSDKLADFAERSFKEGWHDVPPRKGKRGGAFCMSAFGAKESRILLNFGGKLDDVFTVAHELGHAYHNSCLFEAGRAPLQADTPMTLAETASVFCETILVNAALENASEEEKLAILEQDLLGTTQLVVDIHSRFIFESTVFDKRVTRELSIEELNEIMLGAQAATYGDGLDEEARHPYMWAQKGHYYMAGRNFYNFPYTFGYLFGLGLYAQYQRQPEGFHERYDKLLSETGLADASSLAKRFGIDIESPEFWRGSLSVARERAKAYEALVSQHADS